MTTVPARQPLRLAWRRMAMLPMPPRALALNAAKVPVDMRVYAKGGHAFGLRPTADPITTQWPGQVRQWLQDIGMVAKTAHPR